MTQLSFQHGRVYPESVITLDETTYALAILEDSTERHLLVRGDVKGFSGEERDELAVYRLTAENAAELRTRLPWLNPVPLRRQTSFGFGDRLGLATPGYIFSLRATDRNALIAPIFAQQSVRENLRTGRTPQEVLDDAMWSVFQEGWQEPWGADADHVKEAADLLPFVRAGYTFYTIDPSDYVDNDAESDGLETLRQKAAQLPWQLSVRSLESMMAQYCAGPISLGQLTLTFDEETFLRALVKYGRAISHTADITTTLQELMGEEGYDLEMSVDETDTPTTIHEHFFIANELRVRDIPVVSLAPRFVGKFQKGVDYMGDIAEFEAELARHLAILHYFNSYKISIHTGSDKFSIYSIIDDQAQGYVHVKTAGTSYLEALRIVAYQDPAFFRQILDLAHQRFQKERKSYYLDCQPEKVATSDQLADDQLPDLLEQFDSRQLLHVTFGAILDVHGVELKAYIEEHEADYRDRLERHFARHLRPFS